MKKTKQKKLFKMMKKVKKNKINNKKKLSLNSYEE